jgi:putative ABC transport system permease protein
VLFEAKTMEQHLALMLYPPRTAALLLSVFGGLALLLAATGLYGLVRYAVARRIARDRHPYGTRSNRTRHDPLAGGSGLRLVVTGSLIGIALSAAVTWLLSRFLYGIGATDVVTFVAIPLILGSVGFLDLLCPRSARQPRLTSNSAGCRIGSAPEHRAHVATGPLSRRRAMDLGSRSLEARDQLNRR